MPNMRMLCAFAFLAAMPSPVHDAPPPHATLPAYSNAVAGDSLKVTLTWTQAADSAANGKIDSTVYKLRTSKAAVFFGGAPFPANVDTRRSKNATAFADSFKLARPVPGDSAVFQVLGFSQCRKGDCSVPGGAGFQYRSNFAPPPASPNGTKVVVF